MQLLLALLLSGCAGYDQTAVDDATPPAPATRDTVVFVRDELPGDVERMKAFEASDDGGQYGSAEQEYAVPLPLGWAVRSQIGTVGSRSGCVPIDTNYTNEADFTNDILGRCGGVPFNGNPNTCSDFSACIVPNTKLAATAPLVRTYKWQFDTTLCDTDPNVRARFLSAARMAFNVLSNGTAWNFPEETGPTSAPLKLRCMTASEAAAAPRSVAYFFPTGPLTPVGAGYTGTGGVTGPITTDELCNGTNPHFLFKGDATYSYSQMNVNLNGSKMTNSYADVGCPASKEGYLPGSLNYQLNAYANTIIHEVLHGIGFDHQYFAATNDTGLYNPLWPESLCNDGNFIPSMLPAGLRVPMSILDTHNPSTGVGAVDANISCYEPRYNGVANTPAHTDVATADGLGAGMHSAFTDNFTFGIHTGSSHTNCGWGPRGQVCALPPSTTIHWCFRAGTGSQFKNDVVNNSYVDSVSGSQSLKMTQGLRTPTGGSYYGPFKFVYHSNCNDSNVQLVIDGDPVSGSGNNLLNYVALDLPPFTAARQMEPWDFSGNGVPAGTFYNWGASGGFAILHLDTADINASIPSNKRLDVLRHAIRMGLRWVTGLGTRTSGTIPDNTCGTSLQWSWPGGECGHDRCRQQQAFPDQNKRYTVLDFYCGSD